MPSRQTHGDILAIYAVDILVGTECGKNIQLNDVARNECYNRLPHPGELYGPLQYAKYVSLDFWAEVPKEVLNSNQICIYLLSLKIVWLVFL